MKYKLVSKASTRGYKKIETNIETFGFGFPEVNLIPVKVNNKWYIPTAYVCYEEINQNVNKDEK